MAAGFFVGIGAATLDTLWLVDEFPTGESVTQARQHSQQGGGPVATALCVLAKLGNSVCLIDRCGDDTAGDWIRRDLASYGVSLSGMQVSESAASTQASLLVRQRDGARQIVYFPCSAGEPEFSLDCHALIRQATLLHLNGRHEQLSRQAVRVMQESGGLISFDGGAGRYRASLRDQVLASHIRIVALDFARQFSGEEELEAVALALRGAPCRVLVITDGLRGSYVWDEHGSCFHQPAITIGQTVDTTGCGDVYHGAFLHGVQKGWPWRDCASFASQAAALNAEGLGGRYACERLEALKGLGN